RVSGASSGPSGCGTRADAAADDSRRDVGRSCRVGGRVRPLPVADCRHPRDHACMTGDKVVTLAPCVVRHIPPDGVSDAAAHGRPLYLVFWEGRRPAGLRLLLPGELPLPPTALPDIRAATVARQSGDQLEDAAPTATPDETVSVVICTRDRPDDLRRCLMALSRCDPAPAEILVVDNAPADDRAMKVVAERPGVRYVRETRKGLSHARNAGVV